MVIQVLHDDAISEISISWQASKQHRPLPKLEKAFVRTMENGVFAKIWRIFHVFRLNL